MNQSRKTKLHSTTETSSDYNSDCFINKLDSTLKRSKTIDYSINSTSYSMLLITLRNHLANNSRKNAKTRCTLSHKRAQPLKKKSNSLHLDYVHKFLGCVCSTAAYVERIINIRIQFLSVSVPATEQASLFCVEVHFWWFYDGWPESPAATIGPNAECEGHNV